MFYRVAVTDHIRVPPNLFNLPTEEAILAMLKKFYEGYVSKDLGIVIDVASVNSVREGVVIPGDGSIYYDCDFELLAFKPELNEVVYGTVRDIAEFGAFLSLGVVDGMVHIGQTMDDFVSFSKDKVLIGKESKRSLKPGNRCRARIIAVSFKDIANPRIGLTMRQPGLGALEWIAADLAAEKENAKEKVEKEKEAKEGKEAGGKEAAAKDKKKEKAAK